MTNISPRVDIAFKKIFGVEENKDLLISLINSIVSTEDQVAEVTLLNPYNPQSFKTDKLSILDIKAKGERGQRFNIEIQITDAADYDKRALYYWSKLYTEQLQASQGYSKLNKAIGIHILNFTSILNTEKYHNIFHITEKDSGLIYFKDLELHTIELSKFNPDSNYELSDIVAKVGNSLDMWITFLTRNDLLDPGNLPKELNNDSLKKALNVLEVMNFSLVEKQAYEEHLKWLMTEAETLKKAEEKGEARGIEIGEARGIEIGEARGEAKGIEKTAINMIKQNLDFKLISQVTGLLEQEIQKLKDHMD